MIPRLQLHTVSKREDGCFSVLKWKEVEEEDGRPIAVSVERTFENLRTVLGNGLFLLKRRRYNKGGYDTWEITGITGHTDVLFHKGNKEVDSIACVCVAESFVYFNNTTMIGDSKGGFNELMELTSGLNEFYLEVSGR